MNPLLSRIERLEAASGLACAVIIVPPEVWSDPDARAVYVAARRAQHPAWQDILAVRTGVPRPDKRRAP